MWGNPEAQRVNVQGHTAGQEQSRAPSSGSLNLRLVCHVVGGGLRGLPPLLSPNILPLLSVMGKTPGDRTTSVSVMWSGVNAGLVKTWTEPLPWKSQHLKCEHFCDLELLWLFLFSEIFSFSLSSATTGLCPAPPSVCMPLSLLSAGAQPHWGPGQARWLCEVGQPLPGHHSHTLCIECFFELIFALALICIYLLSLKWIARPCGTWSGSFLPFMIPSSVSVVDLTSSQC